MADTAVKAFAEKVSEIMPVIMREFLKQETSEFFKMRITLPQFVVLDILARDGEARMSDLARYINVTTAAMTGIVDRLVKGGYAARAQDKADRRVIIVRPTEKGSRVVKNAIERRKEITAKMFGVVSAGDRQEYLRIISIIGKSISAAKDNK